MPLRRIFQDKQGNEIGEVDLWKYGYDARKRAPGIGRRCRPTVPYVSEPYLSFSIGAPVITVSAPLRGKVPGVLAADLKLDTFSEFVQAQRPGEHGTVMIFDQAGSIIAHPEFSDLITTSMTHPTRAPLPSIDEINTGIMASVIRGSYNKDNYEGNIEDGTGKGFLFRVTKFAFGERYNGSILLLADQDDFVQNVRRLQFNGLILAILVGAAFLPIVWMFGSQMSRSIQRVTAQARELQTLSEPELVPVTSYIKEIHALGRTINLAQRAIWSFAHFVPKEIVRGLIDNSISTRLGGIKQDITVVFTDVQGFTTIAEAADPDTLMRQTSRYFSALTAAFLAEGGTVDKFIGDAVMVFWNAPNPQKDHVARACRAVLAAKAAGERLNVEFEDDGLKPFITRFGIHVGEAVIGNVGSTERMNYTALGNTVNLAARLEGLNKEPGRAILVSEEVTVGLESLQVQGARCRRCQGHDKRDPNFRTRRDCRHEADANSRGIFPDGDCLRLADLAATSLRAADEPIKVGILHSLSGSMAISESVLKDTVLMLIDDQNKKGGLLGRKLEPIVVDPASDWDTLCREGRRSARQGKGGGGIRMLDIALPKGCSAHLRANERVALLPRPIRRRGKFAQHLLSGPRRASRQFRLSGT